MTKQTSYQEIFNEYLPDICQLDTESSPLTLNFFNINPNFTIKVLQQQVAICE